MVDIKDTLPADTTNVFYSSVFPASTQGKEGLAVLARGLAQDRVTLMDLVLEQVTKEVRFYSAAAFVDGLICYGYVLFIWT
jgi:hypothetical protein